MILHEDGVRCRDEVPDGVTSFSTSRCEGTTWGGSAITYGNSSDSGRSSFARPEAKRLIVSSWCAWMTAPMSGRSRRISRFRLCPTLVGTVPWRSAGVSTSVMTTLSSVISSSETSACLV
jgi:hypothetical protein